MNSRLAVAALLLAAVAYPQANTGSISGVVTDPNGAVVPNAKIRAKNIQTGQELETVTTEAGLYVLPSVPVGMYSITAEATGFKRAQQNDIEIRVAQRQPVEFRLEIGDVQQTVEVEAQAQLLEIDNSERGQSISTRFLNTLPLFSGGIRNPEAFVNYMPGVNQGAGLAEVSITGSGGRAKEVLLDGASQTIPESGGTVFNFPASEQFGEFKIVTSNYSAEYGRFGGGLEIFLSRSGTNDIHGGAFLNMRRDIWEAAGYNVNRVPGRTPGFRPKQRFNEIGGVIGGPIFIPKVYDGRNKTFWFFTYVKDVRPVTASLPNPIPTLPTALMKQGNFSELSFPIYDPATTVGTGATATRTPFTGNIIPRNRWSRVSAAILPLIPDPTSPGLTNNYQFTDQSNFDSTHWSLKFDHSFTENNRLAFYMSRINQVTNNLQNFPGPLNWGFEEFQKPENYRVNHDFVFTPTLLLHSTFGFTRQQQIWGVPTQFGFGSKIGLPLTGLSDVFPRVTFQGADQLTNWGRQDGKVQDGTQFNWTFHFTQALTYLRGKHEFKLGWDLRRLRTFSSPVDLAGTNGNYYYTRAQTASPANLAGTGNAFASFLLGAANQADITATPVLAGDVRYGYHAVFFQDTWKVNPRLTLNLGFRYEVPIGWYEANGDYSWIDLNRPNPGAGGLPGALVFAGNGAGRTGVKRPYPTDWANIGPRLGLAYRLTNKTVLRGGWGIYYQTLGNGGCGCREGFSGGNLSFLSDGLNPVVNWDNGGVPTPTTFTPPPYLDPTFGNFKSVDVLGPNFGKAPRIYNWSIGIQHEIKNFLIDVAYQGNRAYRLNSTVELNQLPVSRLALGSLLQRRIDDPEVIAKGFRKPYPDFPNSQTLAQALRPYPQYLNISDRNSGVGRSWYDALQAKVERRFGSFQLMAAYSWSKSLGLMHFRQIFSQTQVNAQDAYNINDAKSFLPFDQTHVLNILSSYDLPFGRGRKWLNGSRWLDAVVGGWTIAGAQKYYSGALIQVSAPNTIGNGVLFSRIKKANVTGAPISTGTSRTDLDPDNPSVRYFNFGASSPFSFPGQYELGNAAFYYDDFRQPPVLTENVSVQKRWKVPVRGDRTVDLVYRADAFNLFNRTNFGVNGTIGSVDFGKATGPQQGPRLITMGLRLDF